MKIAWRHLGKIALAALTVAALFPARPAQAQTVTFPDWWNDSFQASNRYLTIYEYFRDGQESRFQIWTELGDPFNSQDDFGFFTTVDPNNGNITIVWPWGSRLWSGQRPTPRVGTSGDDRPYTNAVTIHVEDATDTTDGFQDFLLPDDGVQQFTPEVVSLPDGQGFFSPYFIGGPGNAAGINLIVNQKVQFARDLVRLEVVVKNNGGSTRRVGARVILDPYVDLLGPTRSIFIPETRERVFFEKEYLGANIPDEWEIYDDDEGPTPLWVAKNILRGNGATPPSRFIIGNTLDMWPFVLANAQYNWVVRPDLELRISDVGCLIYWDPISIPAGQTRSFVTYLGMGVASHGMSDAYISTQSQVSIGDPGQGFIGAVQAPFALPLVNGNSDTQTATVHGFIQNQFTFSMPGTFGFIDLPPGLQFASSGPPQTARKDFGALTNVGTTLDEGRGDWIIEANGIAAGQLPIVVTYGNGFSDTARVTRLINVPQGRRYRFTNDWQMLTFPFNFTLLGNHPTEVFRTLDGVTPLTPGSFQIVRYNPLVNAYENVTEIRAGEGYWVRMLGVGDTDVRLVDEGPGGIQAQPVKLGTRDVFTSLIRRGWNQVGNPSPYTVRLRDLKFLGAGGVIINFDQALASNLIRQGIFHYNVNTGQYEQLGRESLIKPGQGLWIFANSERNIVWPPPQGAALSITP